MRIDITRLPIGGLMVSFLLAITIATFALAFSLQKGAELTPAVRPPPGQISDPVQRGQAVASANGCLACHSITGEVLIGPSWKGIYGKPVTLADGSQVVVDDAYIRESIQVPSAKVVEGFDPVMPSYSALGEADIEAIIAFIKSLK